MRHHLAYLGSDRLSPFRQGAVSARSRLIELLLNCARIGFNP